MVNKGYWGGTCGEVHWPLWNRNKNWRTHSFQPMGNAPTPCHLLLGISDQLIFGIDIDEAYLDASWPIFLPLLICLLAEFCPVPICPWRNSFVDCGLWEEFVAHPPRRVQWRTGGSYAKQIFPNHARYSKRPGGQFGQHSNVVQSVPPEFRAAFWKSPVVGFGALKPLLRFTNYRLLQFLKL